MKLAVMPTFDVHAVRDDFPILGAKVHGGMPLVYLDNAASTQRPRQVIQAMTRVYESQYANVHRGFHCLSELSTDLYEHARETVQQFIHAEHEHEVIFTQGTTASLNLIARSWGDVNVGPRDEILLTEMEHHSNIVPWQQLAQRTGCQIRFLPITDDGLLDIQQLDVFLTERTKLVSVVAVSNVLGTINPVQAVVRRAREMGATIVVDAAQSAPHVATDVQALGADFIAFSGHKMLGPTGVGVLYGRESLLEAMPPFLGGGSMIDRVTLDGFTPAKLPEKFEAGTPPIVPAIGMAAAIEYLQELGLDAIHQAELTLTRRTHDILEAVDGLRILGPKPEQKGGIVSFVIDGVQVMDLTIALDEHGVAVRAGHHCAMPLHTRFGVAGSTRASFYFYNTLDEVNKFGEALDASVRLVRRKR